MAAPSQKENPKVETLNSKKLAGPKPSVSTQQYLDIAEIRDNTVIMKDGTIRAVILVSSINFALKSEDEQNAIIAAYVGFLNSLDFPIQVVVQSRKLNIDSYLDRLKESERVQKNELLRTQISDYRQFIRELIELGQIMSKRFFVVVPLSPGSNKAKGFWQRFSEVLSPSKSVRAKEEKFFDQKKDLDLRLNLVLGGMQSMGLQVQQLDTEGLIELYYTVYNPDIFLTEKLVPTDQLRVEKE
ncbi:MAG: TraC family protein [Candidatus Magasanikbacteria bacterium]|nr:TraC family protein [Candidatus Magasanikbacteria bacterium]